MSRDFVSMTINEDHILVPDEVCGTDHCHITYNSCGSIYLELAYRDEEKWSVLYPRIEYLLILLRS